MEKQLENSTADKPSRMDYELHINLFGDGVNFQDPVDSHGSSWISQYSLKTQVADVKYAKAILDTVVETINAAVPAENLAMNEPHVDTFIGLRDKGGLANDIYKALKIVEEHEGDEEFSYEQCFSSPNVFSLGLVIRRIPIF